MTLRVVIADDEPAARATLRLLLGRAADCELVAECADGEETVAALRSLRPDLLFLDVQMPERDGFGVLAGIEPEALPAVVFVTAYDAHALRAFEVHAVDYLLKPFSDKRFEQALERARGRLRGEGLAVAARRVQELLAAVASPAPAAAGPAAAGLSVASAEEAAAAAPPPGRLLVRSAGRTRVLRLDDVSWIEAADYYVRVHVGGGGHLLRRSLVELERELDPRRFVRVHRSAIVNLDRVVEIRPLFKGDAVVVLAGGEELRVSRSYREAFEAALARR